MRVRFLYFPLLLLFVSPVLMAQKTEEPAPPKAGNGKAYNHEICIRHNGHIDIDKHPKIGLPGGPLGFPGSDWYDMLKDRENYYYEGIGITRKQGYFTYRLWVDYYHLKRQGNSILSTGNYKFLSSGIRLSPGLFKEWQWKFMGFSVGAEIPVYFQTKKTDVTEQPDYIIAGETRIWTYTYKNGVKSVGLTAFAGVEFRFLKRMSAGMEFSNGILFGKRKEEGEEKIEYYDTNGNLYKTDINPVTFGIKLPNWKGFYLIPSLSLSYRL